MKKEINKKGKIVKKPPTHPSIHHDLPPHVFHEMMIMKNRIGKLEGKIEIIQKLVIVKP
ncbi:hypothetical protein KKG65_03660 [Patescibacteria group bacterium]|nr:hypothetical protein [Patescibacteria group bacterium]